MCTSDATPGMVSEPVISRLLTVAEPIRATAASILSAPMLEAVALPARSTPTHALHAVELHACRSHASTVAARRRPASTVDVVKASVTERRLMVVSSERSEETLAVPAASTDAETAVAVTEVTVREETPAKETGPANAALPVTARFELTCSESSVTKEEKEAGLLNLTAPVKTASPPKTAGAVKVAVPPVTLRPARASRGPDTATPVGPTSIREPPTALLATATLSLCSRTP